jgi:hypothetical protein
MTTMTFPPAPANETAAGVGASSNKDRTQTKERVVIRWFASNPASNKDIPTKTRNGGRMMPKRQQVKPAQVSPERTEMERLRKELEEARAQVKVLKERDAASHQEKQVTLLLAIADEEDESLELLSLRSNQFASNTAAQHEEAVPAVSRPSSLDSDEAKSKTPSPQEGSVQKKASEEHSLDREPNHETQAAILGMALENVVSGQVVMAQEKARSQRRPQGGDRRRNSPLKLPPNEIVAILDNVFPDDQDLQLADLQLRVEIYNQKLEQSEDLIASLFRDLEKARATIHILMSRNVDLASKVKRMLVDQEENMVHRVSLVKACAYICALFILCGGVEYFVAAVLLLFVLLEVESSVK